MKRVVVFGILALFALMFVLAGCAKTGQAYFGGNNTIGGDLNVDGKLIVTDKVGIGTSNPTNKLHITGGDEKLLYASKIASGTPIATFEGGYIELSGGAYGIRGSAGNAMYLGANGQDFIYITTDGKVGIGTTNPSAKLEVKGDGSSSHIFSALTNGGSSALTAYSNGNLYLGGKEVQFGAFGAKLRMYSSNKLSWCCGPNDAGVWTCSKLDSTVKAEC